MVDVLLISATRDVVYVAEAGEIIDVQADKTMVTGGDHTRQFSHNSTDAEKVVATDPPVDFVGRKFQYTEAGAWVIAAGWTSYEDPTAVVATGLHHVVEFTDGLRTREVECLEVDEAGIPSGIAQEEIFIYEGLQHVRTTTKKYSVDGDLIYEKTFDALQVGGTHIYKAL